MRVRVRVRVFQSCKSVSDNTFFQKTWTYISIASSSSLSSSFLEDRTPSAEQRASEHRKLDRGLFSHDLGLIRHEIRALLAKTAGQRASEHTAPACRSTCPFPPPPLSLPVPPASPSRLLLAILLTLLLPPSLPPLILRLLLHLLLLLLLHLLLLLLLLLLLRLLLLLLLVAYNSGLSELQVCGGVEGVGEVWEVWSISCPRTPSFLHAASAHFFF
jgi:hypothetical protein